MAKNFENIKKRPVAVAGGVCSVIDNVVLGDCGSVAVSWSARALLAGCGLAVALALPRASAGAKRGAVGAYSRGRASKSTCGGIA